MQKSRQSKDSIKERYKDIKETEEKVIYSFCLCSISNYLEGILMIVVSIRY